jgi:hypothetical protein
MAKIVKDETNIRVLGEPEDTVFAPTNFFDTPDHLFRVQ